MLHFCTSLRFSDVFRGYRNVTLGRNGLNKALSIVAFLFEIDGSDFGTSETLPQEYPRYCLIH